jgi:hypothetical protein
MAIPAWIAIATPCRRNNNITIPVTTAAPNSTADTVPKDPAPAATPLGGPRNVSSSAASPRVPTRPCAIPATNGGRDVTRKCQSARMHPAATASVRIQTATEIRLI